MIVYGERLLAAPVGCAARAAQPRRAARPARPRRRRACSRSRPRRTGAACARPASRPATARATRRCAEPGLDAPRDRRGRSPTATCRVALPAARRPAAHASATAARGSRRSDARADRDRARVGADRHAARVRRRRLPRRGLRREGGHAHAPRRARPAPAPRDRPAEGPSGRSGSGVRAGWQVIAEVAARAGHDLGVPPGRWPRAQLFEAVPFYAGLTLDEIGGRGVRWPEREAASGFEVAGVGARDARGRRRAGRRAATARCGSAPGARCGAPRRSTSRRRCSSCARSQVVELSPADAKRLGIADGDRVEVGVQRHARARRRAAARRGARAARCSSSRARAEDAGERCSTEPLVEVRRVGGPAAPSRAPSPCSRRPRARGRRDAAVGAAGRSRPTGGQAGHGGMTVRRGRLLRGRGGSSS